MPIRLHTSAHPAPLFDALASDLTAAPLSRPTAPEVIVVPNAATGRWLALALARRWGAAANLALIYPAGFLETLCEAVPQGAAVPLDAAFASPTTLAWRIAEVLPTLLEGPAFSAVKRYLEDDDDRVLLLQLAEALAGVVDRLTAHRPQLLRDWDDPPHDAGAQAMVAALYRATKNTTAPGHLAARVGGFISAAGASPLREELAAALPERINVFLPFPLPPLHLDAYAALGQLVPVDFYVLGSPPSSSAGPEAASHPLRESLGGRTAAFLEALTAIPGANVHRLSTPPAQQQSLLRSLQTDLAAGTSTAAPTVLPADAGKLLDGSLQVHSCHSPAREVETLHDQLLL
ncbi:MAG: exodeoxyribonuclease V subunit gamma, partial [Deltaproteobacteria bacterium]|nr:exodeoxyribonuclease V subunit gamma [Deltaproteobacteria bacterium]